MKTSNIIYSAIFAAGWLVSSSCQKSWLTVTPKGTNLEANYYQTPDEAFAGLVAAYDPLGAEVATSYCMKLGLLNTASDDCLAGGGSSSDQPTWVALDNFTVSAGQGPQGDIWGNNYTGIYRSNVLLSKLNGVPGLDAATKSRYTAEARFLRAYYYFNLVRWFKNIPLITDVIPSDQIYNQPQATPDSVYMQIEGDLKAAIPVLPQTVQATTEGGRVTKGAAEALLAKVILWEAGPDDNSRMQEAAQYLDDLNYSGTYHLLSNYGSIFDPANKFNVESVFEIVHTSAANQNWDNWGNFDGNVYVQMIGMRSYAGPDYQAGYGFNPVSKELAQALKGDPRYSYTVINADSLRNANVATYGDSYQNTGFFIKKYAPENQNRCAACGVPELNYPNDWIEIRLADTYLLEAEALVRGGGDLVKADTLLNRVRRRVGLPHEAPTLDNIYKERRLELATEGQRYFDLIRTGQAAAVLGSSGFNPDKNNILPIPLNELNGTKLKQNPGY